MDIATLSVLSALAVTGYGEVVDGQPNWGQRELHVYTNLVRVDPAAWTSEYPCSFSGFTSEEQSDQAPLYYHDGLTAIAQAHSQDMYSNDFMAHESSDGTDFGTRVWPWYDGTMIGENVAFGYADNWDVVFEGWMCSAGHRSNIMASDFEDLGTGQIDRSYTQDFGAGAGTPHIQVAMGIHVPQAPTREVEFIATFEDDEGPNGIWVETADDCVGMELLAGDEARGAYSVEVQSEDGCASYRFAWEAGNGIAGTLPEFGAYVYGDGCPEWTDEEPAGCAPSDDDPDLPDDDGSDSSSEGDSDSGDSSEGGDDAGDAMGQRDSECPGGVASCLDHGGDEVVEQRGCSVGGSSPTDTLWFFSLLGLMARLRRTV